MAEVGASVNNNNQLWANYNKVDLPRYSDITNEQWDNLKKVGDLEVFHDNGIQTPYSTLIVRYQVGIMFGGVAAASLIFVSIFSASLASGSPCAPLKAEMFHVSMGEAAAAVIPCAIALILFYNLRQLKKQELKASDIDDLKTAVTQHWEETQRQLLACEKHHRDQSRFYADLANDMRAARESCNYMVHEPKA